MTNEMGKIGVDEASPPEFLKSLLMVKTEVVCLLWCSIYIEEMVDKVCLKWEEGKDMNGSKVTVLYWK